MSGHTKRDVKGIWVEYQLIHRHVAIVYSSKLIYEMKNERISYLARFLWRTERDSKTVTICFLASQAFRFCWVCNASNALGECEIIFSWFLYVLQRLSIGDATIMLSKIMSIFTILYSKRVLKTKKWNMARILLIPGLSSQLRRAYKINQSSSDLPKIFFLWVHGGIAITRCFTLFLSGRLSAHEILMTQSFYHIWEQYFFPVALRLL